jgi:N utilization substance protein A
LSLAIGKEGQNARLAARLTGWRVDIKSETQLAEEEAYATDEWAQGEWIVDPATGEQLWQPADGGDAVSADAWAHGDPIPGDEVPPPPSTGAVDADPSSADAEPAADATEVAVAEEAPSQENETVPEGAVEPPPVLETEAGEQA